MQARGPITIVKTTDGAHDLRSIAGRMSWAREQRKLSQKALAEKAGVSQGTIGNIESGERKQPRQLLAIARALYCSPEWLESGRGEWDLAKGGGHKAREKGAVYHDPSSEERTMLEVWRRMSSSDRQDMLAQMAEKAERYQGDLQRTLDEAGVKLPFPLTSPVSANAVRSVIAKASATPSRQKELPLETAGSRKK